MEIERIREGLAKTLRRKGEKVLASLISWCGLLVKLIG